jgi:serine/threonine-protein kinase PpkA
LAGLDAAINLDWSPYDARLIVFLARAGPDAGNESLDAAVAAMKAEADVKNIKIVPLLLKTAGGEKPFGGAKSAYEALSYEIAGAKAYVGISPSEPGEGPKIYRSAAWNLLSKLDKALRFEDPPPSGEGTVLGYSAPLDYAKNLDISFSPAVVRAWVADKDLAKSEEGRPAYVFKPAALLTRNQLQDLSESLKAVIRGAENSDLSGAGLGFFDAVIAAAAIPPGVAGRPPLNPDAGTLGELGLFGEFLDGLPYRSALLAMTETDWETMDALSRREFIDGLKAKAGAYERYGEDDGWAGFDPEDPGQDLRRAPLSDLP